MSAWTLAVLRVTGPVVALVAVPVLTQPAWPVGALAGAGGALCATGVLGGWASLVGAGGMVVTLGYALALWLADSPTSVAGAIAFGLALCLVVEGGDFVRRLRDATVLPSVVRAQWRHWGAAAAIGAVIAAGLDGLAGLLVFLAPAPAQVALAVVGALGTVLGAVAMLRRRTMPAG